MNDQNDVNKFEAGQMNRNYYFINEQMTLL